MISQKKKALPPVPKFEVCNESEQSSLVKDNNMMKY